MARKLSAYLVSQIEGFSLFVRSSFCASKNNMWLREVLSSYQNMDHDPNTQNQTISVFIPHKQILRTLSPTLKSLVYGIEMKIRIRWRFMFKEHLSKTKWNLRLKFCSSWDSSFSLSLQLAKTLCVKNQLFGKLLGNNFLRLCSANMPWTIAVGTMTRSPSHFMLPTWCGNSTIKSLSLSLVANPGPFQWNCGN